LTNGKGKNENANVRSLKVAIWGDKGKNGNANVRLLELATWHTRLVTFLDQIHWDDTYEKLWYLQTFCLLELTT